MKTYIDIPTIAYKTFLLSPLFGTNEDGVRVELSKCCCPDIAKEYPYSKSHEHIY